MCYCCWHLHGGQKCVGTTGVKSQGVWDGGITMHLATAPCGHVDLCLEQLLRRAGGKAGVGEPCYCWLQPHVG